MHKAGGMKTLAACAALGAGASFLVLGSTVGARTRRLLVIVASGGGSPGWAPATQQNLEAAALIESRPMPAPLIIGRIEEIRGGNREISEKRERYKEHKEN